MAETSCSLKMRRDTVRTTRLLLLALVIATANVGCEARNREQRLESVIITRSDSAGIQITESSSHALETVLPWVLDTVPDLELGQLDGASASQFYRIQGLIGFPDGRFVVVDAGSRELRWFDHSGEHLFRMGGEGNGPGEFYDPRLVPGFQRDSLLIFDTRARRFTWVAMDGSGYRVQPFNGSRRLLVGAASAAHGSTVLFRTGSTQCLMESYCKSPVYFRWVNLAESASDTIAEFLRQSARTTNLEGVGYLIGGPFDPVPVAGIGPDGPVIGVSPAYELREFDSTGHLNKIVRVDAVPREISEQDLEYVIGRYPSESFDTNQIREMFAQMQMPSSLPAFQALVVDAAGWYWAEIFRLNQSDPSTWLIFNRDGAAQGIMSLPSDVEVHDIGVDYVLGKWVDSLGVEHVRRYRLNRSN